MEIKCQLFPQMSRKALYNEHLQRVLSDIGARFRQMRNGAFDQLENEELLRRTGRNIKKHTMENLYDYLLMLEKNVERSGGVVHWAEDDLEAGKIIIDIARSRNITNIVKGKSMVTEEISLNERLLNEGFHVTETDLGEFIIQMAGESPFHIVGPAIHKTKDEISRLFSRKLGAQGLTTPRDLTMFARRYLRSKFLGADMGITGVNFAVSDTGHIVLFENEGNIRLTTTIPRIHVAIMGIEKVVPDLKSLQILMALLALSCTGQRLPCYVSMIKGPKREDEPDGADEFHLIILDNGRSRILCDEHFREILYCIRCGACLNFCPVYLKAGGHSYGWVYSGPMGSVLTPHLIDREKARWLPFASTLCGKCRDVCPVMIDLPGMLMRLRQKYAEDEKWPGIFSFTQELMFSIYARILKSSFLYNFLSKFSVPAKRIFMKSRWVRSVIPWLNRWERYHRTDFSPASAFRSSFGKETGSDDVRK